MLSGQVFGGREQLPDSQWTGPLTRIRSSRPLAAGVRRTAMRHEGRSAARVRIPRIDSTREAHHETAC